MTDTENVTAIHLPIGGIEVVQESAVISTVLGSCVSICLFDEKRKVAGMNHFMLPTMHTGRNGQAGRFGDSSIPELIDRMLKKGCRPANMTAKIFGGARMLSQFSSFSGISESNVEVAQKILKEYGIRIVASDVGGTRGRKVAFHTENGRVYVRQVGIKDAL